MTTKSELHLAWALIILGAVITLGSGAVGFIWLNRVPDFDTVPFGEQTQFRTADSSRATIYTSTGLNATPACQVMSQDGSQVALGESQRYQQAGDMESRYGFTAASGATYAVTCGDTRQVGRFGVAEVGEFPQAAFLAMGSLGLALSATGGVLVWRRRRTLAGSVA